MAEPLLFQGKRRWATLLLGCALMGCGSEPPVEPEAELLYSVESVSVRILEKSPPAALVTVKGTARSGGWSEIALVPESFDGTVLVYRLEGTAPTGMATMALEPHDVSRLVDPLPENTAFIRVRAQTNEIAEPVEPAAE